MIKTISFLAVASGIAMGAIALAGPQSGAVEAREESMAVDCARKQVQLDEGYGVSRTEWRNVCSQ